MSRKYSILVAFLGTFLIFSCSSPDPSIPIGKARQVPTGAELTIEGTVTVASGLFASSIPYGFAIQDDTGGIYVIDSLQGYEGRYKEGQKVRVKGKTQVQNGIVMLNNEATEAIGPGETITAKSIGIKGLAATQGQIVNTYGSIVKYFDDGDYGYKIYIADGPDTIDIYVNKSTGLLKDSLLWKAADSVNVTGFSSQYDGAYEVDLRSEQDLKLYNK